MRVYLQGDPKKTFGPKNAIKSVIFNIFQNKLACVFSSYGTRSSVNMGGKGLTNDVISKLGYEK